MLIDFYGAFAPLSLTVLGLWFVVVQTRRADWVGSPAHRRRASAACVLFALPGVMSLLALVDSTSSVLWRTSFGVVSLFGVLALVRLAPERGAPAGPVVVAHWAAAALFVAVGLVAVAPRSAHLLDPSVTALHVEGVLFSLQLSLGIAVAWLLMFE